MTDEARDVAARVMMDRRLYETMLYWETAVWRAISLRVAAALSVT